MRCTLNRRCSIRSPPTMGAPLRRAERQSLPTGCPPVPCLPLLPLLPPPPSLPDLVFARVSNLFPLSIATFKALCASLQCRPEPLGRAQNASLCPFPLYPSSSHFHCDLDLDPQPCCCSHCPCRYHPLPTLIPLPGLGIKTCAAVTPSSPAPLTRSLLLQASAPPLQRLAAILGPPTRGEVSRWRGGRSSQVRRR